MTVAHENSNAATTTLISRHEAQGRLHMSQVTFDRWIKRGNFLTPIRIGRRVFFDQAEVEAFIQKCRAGAA